ncbi:TIGR01621 family pseudouridine synthase [uncultured Zhongshania sp.]|uniref:TIGR01621 family pseudouridine synthase n=1 Tax=uncultured Zhongshania sp. TaxID=1642288 RepID=UPI0025F20042|nr:TIGR01621 family pseudouridine synthase [uncultured Zhongshania sp.]|tara:strand:- start:627 stop:1331 length:705 start_codon:yes stop_codon:yes gene_type:complete
MTSTRELTYLIVENNEDYLVVNKAPGVNLHRNQHQQSLLDVLHADFPGESLHLVHRLDDATSGLLLIAKSPLAAAELGNLFANREVEKFYFALADGKPSKKQGTIVGDIKKSRSGSYLLSRTRTNPAVSQFFSYSLSDGRRAYLLKPHTGKTHQLRVVMKSLGVPILGDRRYGPSNQECGRMYLHAMALRFQFRGIEKHYVCFPHEGEAFSDAAIQTVLLDCDPPWDIKWPALN